MTPRPSLLIADPDVRGRLRAVDALKSRYTVSIPGPGEAPLHAARRVRPAVMLLAIPRGRGTEAINTCRLIKTDTQVPPLVGLLDPWGRLTRPPRALEAALADGYLGGLVSPEEVRRFVEDLLAYTRPIREQPAAPGLLRRLLGRDR